MILAFNFGASYPSIPAFHHLLQFTLRIVMSDCAFPAEGSNSDIYNHQNYHQNIATASLLLRACLTPHRPIPNLKIK